jgi:hypothetical protein
VVVSGGKTLFATGFARLWNTSGFAPMKDIVNNFNDPLMRCPLVCADESVPKTKDITAEIRRMIGSRERPLNRKFLPSATLDGAIRLLLLANHDRMLDTDEEMTKDDIKAIGDRIHFVTVTEKCSEYLKSIGSEKISNGWILGDQMAEHAMYLHLKYHTIQEHFRQV